jgi:formylglycine-generating enzyme required for sulfatase activity
MAMRRIFFLLLPIFFSYASLAEADLMAFAKGGCFQMGDTFDEGENDEKPLHEVCVNDFFMDKYEVRQKSYREAMGENPSHFKGDDLPVEGVTWNEAMEYCRKRGKRLPTEAEWEYAARNWGKDVRFGTGTNRISPDIANFNSTRIFKKHYSDVGEYRKNPAPVGSFKPNDHWLYDMSGNVWEWVADRYAKDYYSESPNDNPKGPESGESRVLRGGSWVNGPVDIRASNRRRGNPDWKHRDIGFRCVRNP